MRMGLGSCFVLRKCNIVLFRQISMIASETVKNFLTEQLIQKFMALYTPGSMGCVLSPLRPFVQNCTDLRKNPHRLRKKL